ncbi:predicted protein [Coccidioides posadasii str. Silveira]|uniref:Predicted protein n=1 Tax=Coccidioides posadasii (strain RMSCC 757 / Silveira) TaxID=443226 RepID=E9DE91_COCPS|nr:predicted protein [Coccidioides posadasii str. Silveira]
MSGCHRRPGWLSSHCASEFDYDAIPTEGVVFLKVPLELCATVDPVFPLCDTEHPTSKRPETGIQMTATVDGCLGSTLMFASEATDIIFRATLPGIWAI